MTNDIINNLILYANKHPQGFTINLKDGKITRVYPSKKLRYVTSIERVIEIQGYELLITDYKEIINHFPIYRTYTIYPVLFNKLGELKHDNIFIGGWFDKGSNTYLIEIISIFENKIDAIQTGDYLKQYSIYDLKDKKEIIIKEYLDKIKKMEV